MKKSFDYIKKVNFIPIVLVISIFAITLSGYSVYLYSQKKASLVIFMQSNDTKDARSAVARAIVLKKNNAVNHIEVVFGGDGTIPLAHADQEFKTRLEDAHTAGVVISACGAGMVKNNINIDDLPTFASIFPYGIIRTLDLVSEGYTVMQY